MLQGLKPSQTDLGLNSGWITYQCLHHCLSVCIVLFIYLCLCWVFVADHGLSLVAVLGLLIAVSSLVAGTGLQTSGLQQLRHWGSVVLVQGLSCPAACGILVPRSGMEPVSLALAGGFLTIGSPGKSCIVLLFVLLASSFLPIEWGAPWAI